MKVRCSCLTLLILLMMLGSVSSVLAEDSSTAAAIPDANESVNAMAAPEAVAPDASASIQGIWQFTLADTEITMALSQSGDVISGQAKFEGADPWNGAVAGSVSGRMVHIAMAALQGNVLVSTYMACTAEGDSITGSYVRSDGSGSAAKGGLSASRISSDISGYTPAVVAASDTAEEAQPQTTDQQPATASTKSPFKDVRDLAKGIDPNIMPRFAPL